jgi:hypothetical protein
VITGIFYVPPVIDTYGMTETSHLSESDRITKDIALFESSLLELDQVALTKDEAEVVAQANRYYEDTKYYHEKGDYFTAFGCINYAHGLVDGIRMQRGLLKW